jgi:hypothetical protein
MPPGVLAEHGAWMLEMRMLRAETPADGISAAGKYWTSGKSRELLHQGISYPVYPQWARCRFWARNRHAGAVASCLLPGEERKWLGWARGLSLTQLRHRQSPSSVLV